MMKIIQVLMVSSWLTLTFQASITTDADKMLKYFFFFYLFIFFLLFRENKACHLTR